MAHFAFNAGSGRHFPGGVNYIISKEIYCEIPVPEEGNPSPEYGYHTMKKEIIDMWPEAAKLSWPYYFDHWLAADSDADSDVWIEWRTDED